MSDTPMLPATNAGRVLFFAALAYAALGLVYLLSKSTFSADPEVDLKYIWTAGRLWAEGINPYTDAFARIGDTYFENTNTLDSWLYPPNWWVISRSLAVFEPEVALVIWRSFNAALVCGGVVLVVQAMRPYLSTRWMLAALVLFGFATTMQATPQVLSIGQTSITLYFGLCAILFGLVRGQTGWVVLGLVFVALKPQAGIVVLAGVAALPSQWRAIVLAALATALLCVPSFLAAGMGPTLSGVIDAYLNYDGALEVNSPANTTGLRHLADTVLGLQLSALHMALVAAVLACLGGVVLSWRIGDTDGRHVRRDLVVWIILVMVTVVTFHSYDFIIAAPLLLILFATPYPTYLRVVIGLGLLVIYRSANLAEITGFYHPDTLVQPGSRLDSISAFVMIAVFVVYALRPPPPLDPVQTP